MGKKVNKLERMNVMPAANHVTSHDVKRHVVLYAWGRFMTQAYHLVVIFSYCYCEAFHAWRGRRANGLNILKQMFPFMGVWFSLSIYSFWVKIGLMPKVFTCQAFAFDSLMYCLEIF